MGAIGDTLAATIGPEHPTSDLFALSAAQMAIRDGGTRAPTPHYRTTMTLPLHPLRYTMRRVPVHSFVCTSMTCAAVHEAAGYMRSACLRHAVMHPHSTVDDIGERLVLAPREPL